jgi:hypothetical protein
MAMEQQRSAQADLRHGIPALDVLADSGRAGIYEHALQLSEDVTRSPAAFTGLIAARPYSLTPREIAQAHQRYEGIASWQQRCAQLFAASVRGEYAPDLAKSLLDHLPDSAGWAHHRSLPLESIRPPVFFRTDQSCAGKILEVQCPGSLWGVHELLTDLYSTMGEPHAFAARMSGRFIAALTGHLGRRPSIHHLLDNSSHPAGERFFIQRNRAVIPYFGYDPGLRARDCNFVRAHDFFSLLNENYASYRLQRLRDGDSVYDLPPIALFDQKFVLALPFWRLTRGEFTDSVRQLFPFTTVLEPEGLELEDGSRLTVEEFAALPRRRRSYYLKYAGSDVGRNWGSQAVFSLSKLSRQACAAQLHNVLGNFERGERWIVQRDCESRESVEYVTRSGELQHLEAHSKHSVFCGPGGPIGYLNMYEQFYKVHGSDDTITTIGVLAKDDA